MSALEKASVPALPETMPALSRYSGPEKCAIVLMALGEDAKKLLGMLDEEEIKEVSQAMSSLGVVPSVVVEALVMEFVQRLSGSGAILGSFDQTQRMLASIM